MGQLKVALHSDNASNSSNNWILNRQTTLNLILRQASMAMVIPPNFVTAHVDNGGFYIAMFAYQKIPINSKNKTKTEILMVYAKSLCYPGEIGDGLPLLYSDYP